MNKIQIETLLAEMIEREGGYSDHPADRGGPTRWGVTEQVARAHGFMGDMREFPRAEAERIYRAIYWDRPGFSAVAKAYPRVAAELFDTGVNMGPKVAAQFLQRALNAMNRGATDYPDMIVDGDIGPMTIAALDGFLRKRGAAGEPALWEAVRSQRGELYLQISEKRPANEAFTFGWFNRMAGMR